jgi:hypothetical protein
MQQQDLLNKKKGRRITEKLRVLRQFVSRNPLRGLRKNKEKPLKTE